MSTRSTLLLICLSAIAMSARAQSVDDRSIRDLKNKLSISPMDTSAIGLMYQLGEHYASKVNYYTRETPSVDSAKFYLNKVLKYGDSLHYNRYQKNCQTWIARIFIKQGNLSEGKKWFSMAIIKESNLKHDKEVAELWTLMGRNIERERKNLEEIYLCFDKALNIYHRLGDWKMEAEVRIEIADRNLEEGKFIECERKLKEVLMNYETHQYKNISNVYYLLSVANRSRGNFSGALSYAIKGNENAEVIGAPNIAYLYGELGLVYQGLNQVEESIYWYEKALNDRESRNARPAMLFFTTGFLIQQLIKNNRAPEALKRIELLVQRHPMVLSIEKASVSQSKALCYEALKNYKQAEIHYLDVIKQRKSIGLQDEETSIAYLNMGAFYVNRHKHELGKDYLLAALNVPPGTNTLENEREIHLQLFVADSALQKYVSAIGHLRKYKMLNDSIFNKERIGQVEELQAQFNLAQKEKQILNLNNQNKLQQQKAEQSAILRNIIIAITLLVLGFVYYRYRLKQRSNQQLEEQKREINRKNQKLERLLNEKNWLMKEIHHRTKNNFHMVVSLLGTQAQYIKNPEALMLMDQSRQRIQTMSLVHQKLYQREDFSFVDMGEYIHELVEYLEDCFDSNDRIHFALQVAPLNLNLAHAIPIGLILNEAITNSMKYAFPNNRRGKMTINIYHLSETEIELIISDDGVGLPPNHDYDSTTTMGMNLMRGLSDEIDGTLTIDSKNGTIIRLVFSPDK